MSGKKTDPVGVNCPKDCTLIPVKNKIVATAQRLETTVSRLLSRSLKVFMELRREVVEEGNTILIVREDGLANTLLKFRMLGGVVKRVDRDNFDI